MSIIMSAIASVFFITATCGFILTVENFISETINK